MAKNTIRNLKVFKTNEVSIKTFCWKREGETLPKWPFILQMPKRILSLQYKFNKFLQTYIIFLIAHLFAIFVNQEFFFQRNIEMELKIFFIILEEWFEWQK